ncbi:hypothetical protein [Phycicoccus sp.]|uniref:hypothetical protein n=1 Tax=Phycicoccus sp. TaxID=1902410 RepID=UPI002C8387C4|nr:hypothetical protein [Phycicoccus sp.]HMM95301.1 hypothetical protein [Phycicoccus sp.]
MKHHERTDWAFLGALIRSVTETAIATRLLVGVTTIRYAKRAEPNPMWSEVKLCFDCHGAVMAFIGVGKRPEDRMPKELETP